MDSLSERFAHALKRQGLNMPALAKQVGVTRQTLYNIENGTTKAEAIRAVTLYPLAEALGVRPEWLLYGKGARDLNPSSSGTETKPRSEIGSPSQSVTLDPAILHEAETLVLTDEVQTQRRYSPKERARQLANAYALLIAEGGRLSAAANARFVDTAAERIEEGGEDGQVVHKSVGRPARGNKRH